MEGEEEEEEEERGRRVECVEETSGWFSLDGMVFFSLSLALSLSLSLSCVIGNNKRACFFFVCKKNGG